MATYAVTLSRDIGYRTAYCSTDSAMALHIDVAVLSTKLIQLTWLDRRGQDKTGGGRGSSNSWIALHVGCSGPTICWYGCSALSQNQATLYLTSKYSLLSRLSQLGGMSAVDNVPFGLDLDLDLLWFIISCSRHRRVYIELYGCKRRVCRSNLQESQR